MDVYYAVIGSLVCKSRLDRSCCEYSCKDSLLCGTEKADGLVAHVHVSLTEKKLSEQGLALVFIVLCGSSFPPVVLLTFIPSYPYFGLYGFMVDSSSCFHLYSETF